MENQNQLVIKQRSFRSQALDQIRQAIVLGTLEAGSMHSETSIATWLSISRTPVREALLQLAQEGLVEFIPQRGVQIAGFDQIYLAHMFQLRAAIEGFCVDQLAANPDGKHIRAFRLELARQKELTEANLTPLWPQANVDFHLLIVRSANNPLIDEVVQPLVSHTMRFGFHTNSKNAHMHRSFQDHCDIVDAIESGDRQTARNLASEHLLKASLLMEKLVGNDG